MSLTELSDRVGVTVANLSILKTGKARAIRFSTPDALCRELGCQNSRVIAFANDRGARTIAEQSSDTGLRFPWQSARRDLGGNDENFGIPRVAQQAFGQVQGDREAEAC